MSSVAVKQSEMPQIPLVGVGAMRFDSEGFADAWKAAWSQAKPPSAGNPLPDSIVADNLSAARAPIAECDLACETVAENLLRKSPVFAGPFLGCALCLGSRPPYSRPRGGNTLEG